MARVCIKCKQPECDCNYPYPKIGNKFLAALESRKVKDHYDEDIIDRPLTEEELVLVKKSKAAAHKRLEKSSELTLQMQKITETIIQTHKKVQEAEQVSLKEDVVLRPAFLDDYIEARSNKTYWTKREEELKPQTKAFLIEHPSFKDIYWTKTKGKPKYDAALLYELISKKVPFDVLESVTIKTIDEEKLDSLLIAEYINPEDLDGCWEKGKEAERIEIPANRKRKKEPNDNDSGTNEGNS